MGLLAETFRKRLSAYLEMHKPTRVLVGGLPDSIIDEIARHWSSGFRLYVLKEAAISLPRNVFRCNADDLTAERQNSWAALVGAEESRKIQESIRSAGAGTVRELWETGFPWQACELPGARWADIINDFIINLSADAKPESVENCIEVFRDELRDETDAAKRFFEVLDAFKKSSVTYSDICFQLGFPSHAEGRILRRKGDNKAVLALLEEFIKRFREEATYVVLAELKEITKTLYSSDLILKGSIDSALEYFTEKVQSISPADLSNPVRTWRAVFLGDRIHWEVLSADIIATLLTPDDAKPEISEYNLSSGPGMQLFDFGENKVIIRDRNSSSPSVTAHLEFGPNMVDQATRQAAHCTPWKLSSQVNRRSTTLLDPLPLSSGPHVSLVALPTEGKQSVSFFAGPVNAPKTSESKSTPLWECCEDYPFFVVTSSSRLRATRKKKSKDENDNLQFVVEQNVVLPAQGRVALNGFIYQLEGDLTIDIPERSVSTNVSGVIPIPQSQCHQFVRTLDVSDGSEVTFLWSDSSGVKYRAVLTFEIAGKSGPRDDSLTGVLVRAHGGVNSNKVKDYLNAVKKGEQVPCSEDLVKRTVKPIARLELIQQDPTAGWWPILVSDGSLINDQSLKQHPLSCLVASASIHLNAQANPWRGVMEATLDINKIPSEISAYISIRTKIIDGLKLQFNMSIGELADEINLARYGAFGLLRKDVLKDYFTAYTALLKAANDKKFPESWRWIARCIDTVLLFSPYATGPTAHLLGPFHPVTISRLFFLQECLIERLLAGEPSSLAQIFAEAQPLALGHVLDPQLQQVCAISFPTRDYHWLWIWRQQGHSELPADPLVEWLRDTGLDPQAGPLAVDPEILPQTLNQYIFAYPSHQTIRVLLEDCSQGAFKALKDCLILEDGAENDPVCLGNKLPGGVIVYDPITKVKRLDGVLLAHDPELPLSWHHGGPPQKLLVDIATLPRSGRVDFQRNERGGAFSACVPTVRRGLLQFSSAGMEVSSGVCAAKPTDSLQSATLELLLEFEPKGQQLSWGTSLSMTERPKANWTLCSASQVDPRLFIEYVKRNPGTALWTYRLFSIGENRVPEFGRGHFLIAKVSPSLASGLLAQLRAIGSSIFPNDLLTELANAGLTLGDEFLRTGRTAEGALGQYLVQCLIWKPAGQHSSLPHWEVDANGVLHSAGYLLQVDPFSGVLDALSGHAGEREGQNNVSHQRSDLVSIQLKLCGDELWIRPVVFESKYLSGGQPDIENAAAQAAATASQFDHLLEFCLNDSTKPHDSFWAQPERLLLAEIIHLGLRLASGSYDGNPDEWHKFERRVLSKVLSGDFRRDNAQAVAIIHHPGPTINNLKADLPHAYVSFADVRAVQDGKSTSAYSGLQKTLADIVRHGCGQQSLPALPSSLSAATTNILLNDVPAHSVTAPNDNNLTLPAELLPPVVIAHAHVQKEDKTEEMATPASTFVPDAAPSNVRSEEINRAHKAFDNAFEDFIGNNQAIEKLRDDLVDALIKRPPFLPSAYLFKGNPSTGKTTIANKIAKLLGVTFVNLVGTNIRSEDDLVEQVDNAFQAATIEPRVSESGSQGLPEHDYPECLIFIDEIHLVKARAQEGLLTLTEPKDRYIRLRDRICRFPRATYIAATTRPSEIDKALLTRFGNPIHLVDYTVQEVAKMLTVKKEAWQGWPEPVLCGIAQLARRIPREAERLAQKLERKMAVSREKVPLEVALEKLRLEEGLDRHGLDHVCWSILRYLAKQSRPLGREALAQQIGLTDADQIIDEKIPNLVSLGLIESAGSQGQKITDCGRNYLRNESPPSTT